MTVPIATVIGGRRWEGVLVEAARGTGLARVVARCVHPDEVTNSSARVVVVGSETPWLTPAVLRSWRRRGLAVVGVHPPHDRPGHRLLTQGGCDLVVDDGVAPCLILGRLLSLAPPDPLPSPNRLVTVTGPRGAPGRSEIALGLSWVWGRRAPTLLAETDHAARSAGLRLGLPPVSTRVGLRIETVGPVDVLHLSPGGGPLAPSLVARTLAAARERYRHVVVDAGPGSAGSGDVTVIVTTPDPVVLVRTASLLERWEGPPPFVVANRLDGRDDLRRVRRATGLEPVAAVPQTTTPEPGSPPPDPILREMEGVAVAIRSSPPVGSPPDTYPGTGGPSGSLGPARRPTTRPRDREDG